MFIIRLGKKAKAFEYSISIRRVKATVLRYHVIEKLPTRNILATKINVMPNIVSKVGFLPGPGFSLPRTIANENSGTKRKTLMRKT
jgi:hypothetical protein